MTLIGFVDGRIVNRPVDVDFVRRDADDAEVVDLAFQGGVRTERRHLARRGEVLR